MRRIEEFRGPGRPRVDREYNPDFTYPPELRPRKKIVERFNRMPIEELRWVDGDMNAAEFQLALDRLGIDRMDVGEWLGMSQRQGHRLAAGDAAIPPAVGKLLTLMLRLGLKPEQV